MLCIDFILYTDTGNETVFYNILYGVNKYDTVKGLRFNKVIYRYRININLIHLYFFIFFFYKCQLH